MFALPRATPNPVRCASPTYRSPADPVVAALRVTPDVVLQTGSTGPAVAAVQQALGGTAIDGQFGAATHDLVLTYQERRHLPATGTITRAVRADLISYLTNDQAQLAVAPAAPAPVVSTAGAVAPTVVKPTPTPVRAPAAAPHHYVAEAALRRLLAVYRNVTLRPGSLGQPVVALQRALRVTPVGHFGPKTQAAVLAFQRTRHLPATGVVTNRMWLLLAA
jgi:peptidoglycan hydrolase-like protein with peptidoglycan-binding domain